MNQIHIEIKDNNRDLLSVLQMEGIYLPAYCGGVGKCGKCKVRFVNNAPEPSDADRKYLREDEISGGWRLACTSYVSGQVELEVPETALEEDIDVAVNFEGGSSETKDSVGKTLGDVIAVDIGTTTIAASFVDRKTGQVSKAATTVNHQRLFGGDVISRIDASNNGSDLKLQETIVSDLNAIARELGGDGDTPMVISGNSTMEHLLQRLPCHTLGVAPYTPVDISLHETDICGRHMTILPGVCTFVGADIVSGVVACDMDLSDEISLLVDLGTNGEMVIGNKNRMICASTAAGPAFEGGNISCGVAGVPGAISKVVIDDDEVSYETIGGQSPIGLCGTGVLEVMYELLANELCDETGALESPYDQDGYTITEDVSFSPKDVREIQLAKSAIRSGMEVLIHEYGVSYDEIDKVYLAGGFGQKIDLKKAAGIGLLPEELLDKTKAVGNSSLAGAIRYAKDPSLGERFKYIAENTPEISLAEHPLFQEYYMEYMFFPEED